MRKLNLLFLLLLTSTRGFAADAPSSTSLIPNGSFEVDANGDHWPDGWPTLKSGARWQEENGNHFLRLTSSQPGETVLLYRLVDLPPGTEALEMNWRWRCTDLKPGKEPWFDARIILNFKDATGKKLSSSPDPPYLRSSTKGWEERTIHFPVPQEARSLEFMPALFQVEKGTLDLDDITIKPTGAGAIKAAANAAAPTEELAPELPQPQKWPPELHVAGSQVQTRDGKTVWLQGVNVVSLDWSVTGEHVLRSVQVSVDEWKSNLIRLTMSDDFWFGTGQGQKDGGAAYRGLVEAAVNIAANRGAYILLDLHRYRAPTEAHVKFWKEVAAHFKNHPAVLFDLLNEPHDISWEVWRHGGVVTDTNNNTKTTFQSPGMQGLVDAVRGTGAHNILIAGGLDWAYDLSGIVNGFALEDRGGNGIIYATHIYPWKRDWKGKVLIAANKYPILVGEVGCDIKKMPFIPAEQQEDPYTWAPDMLGFIQKYRLNWTAFSFHPGATPVIITAWDYTPTPFWGAFVKSALLGGEFGLKRMR